MPKEEERTPLQRCVHLVQWMPPAWWPELERELKAFREQMEALDAIKAKFNGASDDVLVQGKKERSG